MPQRTEEEQYIFALCQSYGDGGKLVKPSGNLLEIQEGALKTFALETIDLKDYLSRTLSSAVEYCFVYLIKKKDRNFTLWESMEWKSFFIKMISLYKELIKQSGVGFEETYEIFLTQLPAKMIEALRHALESELIPAMDLTIDSGRAVLDMDYLDYSYAQDPDVAKKQCLTGLEDRVCQHLQRGFDLVGKAAFVQLLQYYLNDRDKDDRQFDQANFADGSKESNEMMAQITVMTKRIADRIGKLLRYTVVLTYLVKRMLDDFSDGAPDCLQKFLDKKYVFINALRENHAQDYEGVINAATALSEVFIELNDWPILTRTPKYIFQIVGNIIAMFTELVNQTGDNYDGDDGKQRAIFFTQAFNDILADQAEFKKRIF